MSSEFNTYVRKLKQLKEFYLIDEEAYGDWSPKELNEMKQTLDDFVRYVELSYNPKPSQQGNWCDPFGDDIDNILNSKRYGFKV